MVRNTETLRELTALQGLTPIVIDDVDRLIDLMNACKLADAIETIPNAEQLRFQFETPGIDIIGNIQALRSEDGSLYGVVSTIPLPGADCYHIQAQVSVHPDFRADGLEDLMLEYAIANATEWQARTGNRALIQTGCRSDQQHFVDLYERHGFSPVRYFHTLERDLTLPIDEAPAPPGILIRSIDVQTEAEALHLTLHESFQDHFNPVSFTVEQTRHWASSPEFRSDLILLAFHAVDGVEVEPAAISMNQIRENYNRQHNKLEGEVNALGVRRQYRRQGIARAILTRSLELLKKEGMTTASLSVDSINPLGATQLYASVGFTQRKTAIVYQYTDNAG